MCPALAASARNRGYKRNAAWKETATVAESDSDSDDKEATNARNTAYRYLSFRPRSKAEVECRLTDKGFAAEVVRRVLDDLERFGYINDAAFAAQWAGSRIRLRGFGRRRIERELREKGVGSDVINTALAGLYPGSSEMDVAVREAKKKMKTLMRLEPEARRRRLAGFLERKGFSSSIIGSILRSFRATPFPE